MICPTWIACIDGGPRRVNHAAVIVGKNMIVIGGYYTGLRFRMGIAVDTYIFSLVSFKWKLLEVNRDEAPCMRYGHTAVTYKNCIYVWGGRSDSGACNTLYKLDVEKRAWSKLITHGAIPPKRDGHAASLIGSKMYIYGGFLDEPINQYAEGLAYLDLETLTWHNLITQGPNPSCRDFLGMVSFRGKLYLFGGRGTETPPFHSKYAFYPSDLHIFDERSCTWSIRYSSLDGPVGRRSLSMFVYKDEIYVFGGFNALRREHFNDLFKYAPRYDLWTCVKPHGTAPTPRRRQSCLLAGSRVYIFGGTSPRNPFVIADSLDENESNLRDHHDLHILEMEPTLRSLCIKAVVSAVTPEFYLRTLPRELAAEVLSLDPRTKIEPLPIEEAPTAYRTH